MVSPPPELLADCRPPAISREVLPAIAAGRTDDAGRAYVIYVLRVEAAFEHCQARHWALRTWLEHLEQGASHDQARP